MPIKKKIFLITALLYILYTIFPLFADTFRVPVWLPSLAAVVVMIILYPEAFANKAFFWFMVYAIVLGLYVVFHHPLTIGIGNFADKRKILIEFSYILPTVSIFSILCYLNDIELTRKLVNWSIAILFVSFISVVPLMQRFNSLREALNEQGEGVFVPGLPDYSLMHAYTLFLPSFCYAVQAFQGWKKWLSIIGLLMLCFVIYDTFVTTSLIIMVVTILFTVLYTQKNPVVFGIMVILIFLVFYVLYEFGVFIALIDKIMPVFEGTSVEYKLIDFKSSMLQGELTGGSILGRQSLHDISWNSFFQNPFFGTSVVGGHSSLIDRFGGMGFIAGLPFVMIFVSYIKRMVKLYNTKMAKAFFWAGIIAGFTYLYQKGNWGSESWLMYVVLMPMGILTFENKVNSNVTKAS